MHKLLGWLGLFAGSAIGWVVGIRFGFMPAFILSVVGTGVGLYVGRRISDTYF